MKRYLVRIEFDKCHVVEVTKAKDNEDLKKKVAERYVKSLCYYNDMKGIEYGVLSRKVLEGDWMFVGEWINAESLKDYISGEDKKFYE